MTPSQRSLFDDAGDRHRAAVAPLAARMRPTALDEFVGQSEAVGEGTWLRRMIAADTLTSIIIFGPAGTGKTTLARIVAGATSAHFDEVSAVSGSVADLRKAIDAAGSRLGIEGRRTILFIDEIHRFSKSQQDALLHAVEDRVIILIGATTENPYFEVNPPLVSRSRVIELKPLTDEAIAAIVRRAITDERGLAGLVVAEDEVVDAIVLTAGGDARVALTTLELAAQYASSEATAQVGSEGTVEVTVDMVRDVMPSRQLVYDKRGDAHYDVISAFIKSMRGSDPDAAIYWLARMLHGGEDPKFIGRRMFIFASEDVGNADPQAVLIAEAAFRAAEVIGMPECRINLAQAAVYLALAPKSNRSYLAIDAALNDVRTGPMRQVPSHLRDRHRPGSEAYGRYRYPHDAASGWLPQRYLPEGLEWGAFFRAGARGWEAETADRLRQIRNEQKPDAASGNSSDER